MPTVMCFADHQTEAQDACLLPTKVTLSSVSRKQSPNVDWADVWWSTTEKCASEKEIESLCWMERVPENVLGVVGTHTSSQEGSAWDESVEGPSPAARLVGHPEP